MSQLNTMLLVLTNRWLNTMGARFVYGLPAYSVDFSGD